VDYFTGVLFVFVVPAHDAWVPPAIANSRDSCSITQTLKGAAGYNWRGRRTSHCRVLYTVVPIAQVTLEGRVYFIIQLSVFSV